MTALLTASGAPDGDKTASPWVEEKRTDIPIRDVFRNRPFLDNPPFSMPCGRERIDALANHASTARMEVRC